MFNRFITTITNGTTFTNIAQLCITKDINNYTIINALPTKQKHSWREFKFQKPFQFKEEIP